MSGSANTIDLRSDTVTLPTDEMREAMARAELGDDVYGEDPTVNQLERIAAEMLGKEAAMFVASGTMGNLAAMLSHCPRGTKALLGAEAHTYVYEAGGAAAFGGIVMTPLRNTVDGELDLDQLREELERPPDVHFAAPSLIALENTHNLCAGAAVELSHMAAVAELANRRGLPVHLDGARIFNAALALETSVAKIAATADTVSFCLSKGLACPVGSILCGSAEFIGRARRTRKALGGGMRQAGVLAAAGIVALEKMVDRLAEDHLNARALAQGLALVAGINVRPVKRRTNMVVFDIEEGPAEAAKFVAAMREREVLIGARGPSTFRAVTHYGISRAAIDRAVAAASEAAAAAFGD
ncbi:MAG TPA: low-specificity L-threonine aldolase [Candidatus Binataceae bacterium]|nr:low-specificity L-threonine aldolase [Candidatus Binataceae bacterium]